MPVMPELGRFRSYMSAWAKYSRTLSKKQRWGKVSQWQSDCSVFSGLWVLNPILQRSITCQDCTTDRVQFQLSSVDTVWESMTEWQRNIWSPQRDILRRIQNNREVSSKQDMEGESACEGEKGRWAVTYKPKL